VPYYIFWKFKNDVNSNRTLDFLHDTWRLVHCEKQSQNWYYLRLNSGSMWYRVRILKAKIGCIVHYGPSTARHKGQNEKWRRGFYVRSYLFVYCWSFCSLCPYWHRMYSCTWCCAFISVAMSYRTTDYAFPYKWGAKQEVPNSDQPLSLFTCNFWSDKNITACQWDGKESHAFC
jgi:hypothetical protein